MSYINYEIMCAKNLDLFELGLLQLIKQNKTEHLAEVLQELNDPYLFEDFVARGLVEYVKGKPGESEFQRMRATKKAVEILEDVETASITDTDIRLFEWLEATYKNLGKETGNKKKCKNFIAQFAAQSGICRNHLAYLCQAFINDDREVEFSHKLEYLFFRGANLFSVKFDLYQSRLYQYYEKNKEFFDKEFERIENN